MSNRSVFVRSYFKHQLDSKPFYRAVMDLHRFKFLLGCLRFDDWCTSPEKKLMANLRLFQKFEIFFSETFAWY